MATFKVFVDPTTRSDGTHRIRIRAYHRDSRTTINTSYTVGKGEFTKGGKIKDAAIVDACNQLIAGWHKIIASLTRNAVGLDKYTVHELLNHSDSEMKITDRYIERDWQRLFDAHAKVVRLVDWNRLCDN